MGVDSSTSIGGQNIGGFLAKTTGTITVVDGAGNTLVDAVPVTAGAYLPLPFLIEARGVTTVTLADGASGTLAV